MINRPWKRDPHKTRSNASRIPSTTHSRHAIWRGMGGDAGTGMLGGQSATTTPASSRVLGTASDLATQNLWLATSVAEGLHPGSTCIVTYKHTYGGINHLMMVVLGSPCRGPSTTIRPLIFSSTPNIKFYFFVDVEGIIFLLELFNLSKFL